MHTKHMDDTRCSCCKHTNIVFFSINHTQCNNIRFFFTPLPLRVIIQHRGAKLRFTISFMTIIKFMCSLTHLWTLLVTFFKLHMRFGGRERVWPHMFTVLAATMRPTAMYRVSSIIRLGDPNERATHIHAYATINIENIPHRAPQPHTVHMKRGRGFGVRACLAQY